MHRRTFPFEVNSVLALCSLRINDKVKLDLWNNQRSVIYRRWITLVLFAGLQACAIAQSVKSARQIYDSASPSVFLIFSNDRNGKPNIFGTGFEIAPRTIATNAHVIAGGSPLLASGATRIPAQILSIDSVNDLAILTVDDGLPASSIPLTIVLGRARWSEIGLNRHRMWTKSRRSLIRSLRLRSRLRTFHHQNALFDPDHGSPLLFGCGMHVFQLNPDRIVSKKDRKRR